MTTTLMVKVAGVSFEGRQAYLAALKGDEPCRIVAEPDNPFDANALAVHIAMHDGNVQHCGFVPRDLAAKIAPLLEGEPLMVKIDRILGGGEYNYGLLLSVALPFDTGSDQLIRALNEDMRDYDYDW